MCKFSSKSGGVPFQISLFLGDLTRNDPNMKRVKIRKYFDHYFVSSEYSRNCEILVLSCRICINAVWRPKSVHIAKLANSYSNIMW